jgi:flagellin-like hook-associated protein FlgL
MKKNELKKMLKPLIKECIKEVIFEEGALSTIISEVMKGTSGSQQIVETKTQQPKQNFARQERKLQEAKERKRKLLDSIGKDAFNGVNLFEGTTPAPAQKQQGQGPLDGVAPSDPGVDISSIFSGHSANIWQKLSGKD